MRHKNNCGPAYLRCLLLLTSEQQKMQEGLFFFFAFFIFFQTKGKTLAVSYLIFIKNYKKQPRI